LVILGTGASRRIVDLTDGSDAQDDL